MNKAKEVYQFLKFPITMILIVILLNYGLDLFNSYNERLNIKNHNTLISKFNSGKNLFNGSSIISKKDGWTYNSSEKIFQKDEKYFKISNLRLVP